MKPLSQSAGSVPAIFDDIEPTLSGLTELGEQVSAAAARRFREHILLLAAFNGWQVIHHRTFLNWVIASADTDLHWIVLDPLLHSCEPLTTHRVRLTRTATEAGWRIFSEVPEALGGALCGKRVGIIDDVASSGGTIRHLMAWIERAGGVAEHVIIGASTAGARESVRAAYPSVRWAQFHACDVSAIHLRDGCQLVPHAGRRVSSRAPLETSRGPVEARVPPTAFRGGLWEILCAKPDVHMLWWHTWRQQAERFSAALGRPATIADIPLCGDGVTLLSSTNALSPQTELMSIW